MKRSSLTNQQRDVLEALLAAHGPVATSAQVAEHLSFEHEQSERRFIATLVDAGWLVRIKNGLYQIADISSLGTLTLSRLTIAQLLVPESYISFQTALQQHGLYDQGLKSVSSVALKQREDVQLEGTTYSFVKTKSEYFFGFVEEVLDGRRVRVATPEKAILDLLQFKRTATTVDLTLELLREQAHNVQLERLTLWAQRLPVAVQRVVGFLLDAAQLPESDRLTEAAQQGTSAPRLTPESSVYDAKWRLYIDPYFVSLESPA